MMFIKGITWSGPRILLLIGAITQGNRASAQDNDDSGFECIEEDYQPDPRSCSIYYRCVNWGNGSPLTKFKFECGPGTVFSHAKGDICVHPRESERSECSELANDLASVSDNPSLNGETGPPAAYPDYPSYGSPLPGTPSSGLQSTTSGAFESTSTMNPWPTSTNYPGSADGENKGGTLCQQEGFKPDEKNCRKFIRCVSNGSGGYHKYEFTCGEGTVWDPSIEACNHAWAVSNNNCGEMSNGVSNVGGGSEGSNEQSGYPGSSGEHGYTEEPESNEVPRPQGGYPQGNDGSTEPGGEVSDYPHYPNQGYPQHPHTTASSYPPQRPQGPTTLYPPPPRPDEKPSQPGDNSPGSPYPPSYPGVPATQPNNPSTSESPDSSGPTESPEKGPSRPPGGLYPPPAPTPGEETGTIGTGQPKPDASGSCKEEGFFPDPSDCRKFYRCVKAEGSYQKYEFTCGEGTAWDQALSTCNHDYAVPGCGSGGGSHRPGGPESETIPSSSLNEVTSEPGAYPQGTEGPTVPEGTVSGYPQNPPDASGSTQPADSGAQSPEEPSGLYPTPPSAGYPSSRPDEKPSQPGDSSPGSSQPPTTPPERPSTSEPSESPGTTESPDEGSSRPPGGLSPPPSQNPEEVTGASGTGKPKPDASGSCKQEGFMPDSSDCRKFYRCVKGEGSYQKYEFTCGEGTAWDQALLTCNHDYAVSGCGSSGGSDRPGGTGSDSTPSSSSNEVTSEPDSNQQTTSMAVDVTSSVGTTEEPSGTTVASQSSSNPSTETSAEGTTEKATSEGPTSEATVSESPSPSEATPSQTSTSSSTTSPSPATPSSPDGSSTTTKPGDGSTVSPPVKPSSGSCEAEGFFADPSDCHKFYQCVSFDHSSKSFTKFKFNCGPGTAWDQNLQTCNYEDQVESCEGSGGSKPSSEGPDKSTSEIPPSTRPAGSSEGSSPSSAGTEEPPTPATTTDSSESTSPSSAETEETITPVATTETSEATTPSSSETDETPTSAATTESSESTTTSSETEGTTPLDATESTPDMSSEATTSSGATDSSTDEPTDTTTPTSGSSSSSPGGATSSSQPSSSKFKCTDEGFFPNPSDCHKFIRCVKVNNGFIKYEFDCGPGTAWDQNLLTCNYEAQVESCEAGGSSGGGAPPTDSSPGTTESGVTESSTTSGDQSTSPESTEGTTDGSTGAESTTVSSGEGETTPSGGEETTTESTDQTATTEGTGATEETGGTEVPATTDSTPAVPPGSMAEPCAIGNLTDQQIVLVCPTGFRRHPKFCNMFYQCTTQENMEIKILVMVCPEGTIFDDERVQCLVEAETIQKCMTTASSSRFYRQLDDSLISPVRVTRSTLCPDEGHYPYQEGCSNAFYKCKRNSRNSLDGYLYKCPKDFVYWSVSRRCERASRLPMCSQLTDENNERRDAWESRSNLPIEEFNLSARSLKI
ncbi:uncharacterized protein LOC135164555 [Diachasmimorpha longicaudata]|uniref:uncharacterized protein LOC135164555 n=1 Tax=Diachasmimorpha longicaudata TaxID=58733 RepID=UPI0030B8868B